MLMQKVQCDKSLNNKTFTDQERKLSYLQIMSKAEITLLTHI